MNKPFALSILALAVGLTGCQTQGLSRHAGPKKLLVVTTTTGFRHSSIPTAEKILAQLAKDSGEFTVEFVQQPPGHAATGFPVKLKPEASEADKAAFNAAETAWNKKLKVALKKLSPASLKNYDGVVFASTTGDLPIPDPQGFLDWIKAGHAFIGIHAASDTFHGFPEFIEMLGGEFAHHGPQVSVECLNEDPQNPATAHLGKTWTIQLEEIYQFKNYDSAKVHDLLILDKHPENNSPGHFPVSWCKPYGAGRVFYTSLGHREDIWDADPNLPNRKNSAEISQAYDAHVLGGIEWALDIKPAAAAAKTPAQNTVPNAPGK
ncbi:MAG: ThuA domain-containing protein [Verrucomicrobiia bacterium]